MSRILPVVLALAIGGCFPYYGQPGGSSGDTQSFSGELTSGHSGWRDPQCWDCHAQDEHNSGLAPHQCVSCHGENGARGGHTSATPCAECHGQPHGASGFPDPESCQTCHPH